MSADFLDTNVLVYAYESTDPVKLKIARDLLRRANAGEMIVSVQVLAEFAMALLHKLSPPTPVDRVLTALDALTLIPAIQPDAEMVRRAVEARARYGVHFYDGLIIGAAERAGCPRIWTEDFASGQEYFGVRAENPFR